MNADIAGLSEIKQVTLSTMSDLTLPHLGTKNTSLANTLERDTPGKYQIPQEN